MPAQTPGSATQRPSDGLHLSVGRHRAAGECDNRQARPGAPPGGEEPARRIQGELQPNRSTGVGRLSLPPSVRGACSHSQDVVGLLAQRSHDMDISRRHRRCRTSHRRRARSIPRRRARSTSRDLRAIPAEPWTGPRRPKTDAREAGDRRCRSDRRGPRPAPLLPEVPGSRRSNHRSRSTATFSLAPALTFSLIMRRGVAESMCSKDRASA